MVRTPERDRLVGALRQHVHSGQRPVLRQSRYQELLMETRLVADVPQSHQLRWPPAASVVARRLGGGDWARALAEDASPDERRRALGAIATMVGGLALARAFGPTPFSDEILAAAKSAIG